MNETDADKIARFLFEAGQLKRVARSGWWAAGLSNPESVADHSFRAALIAAFLARLEGADVERSVVMALFHDIPEARINDLHKVAQKYMDLDAAQDAAARDQAASLPGPLDAWFLSMHEELHRGESREARVVKDADRLECLLQAHEYRDLGTPADDWIENAKNGLSTDKARELARAAVTLSPHSWWKGLKKL